MPSTVILADDLTGACDSAAAFAACGQDSRVALGRTGPEPARNQVISYSLEARDLRPEDAARRMWAAAERMSGLKETVLFCKIDSAGRGPVGEAVLNYMDASQCSWTVLAPSFPDQGRTVKDGLLEVVDRPGAVRQIAVESLFPQESRFLMGRIPCGEAEKRETQMRAALDAGKRILICDARTQEDLADIVHAAMRMDRNRVLWCGSAGLARALAESCISPPGAAHSAYRNGEACLVFAGTPHHATAEQIKRLAETEGVVQMECGCGQVTHPASSRCIVAAVCCGETSDAQVREVWERTQGTGGAKALVLTGGDTASLVLRALAAESILVRGEVSRGIPWGVIEGGMAAGYRVVTKSGGFGGHNALIEIVRFMEQMP